MSLSEHALCTGVIRKVLPYTILSVHTRTVYIYVQPYNYSYHYFTVAYYVECTYSILPPVQNGAKIFDGTPLPVTCEKDVFDYLNTEYRVATERDHP